MPFQSLSGTATVLVSVAATSRGFQPTGAKSTGHFSTMKENTPTITTVATPKMIKEVLTPMLSISALAMGGMMTELMP